MNPQGRRLVVTCKCGKAISIAAEHRGKRIKCRECGRELTVGIGLRLSARLGAALTLLSLGYVTAICALTALLWWLGDVWWPATVLLFMGRWVFLLPLIVLLPAALVFRRVLAVPLAIGALICVGPLMGFRLGWRRLLPHDDGVHVRVLTFNVAGGDALAPRLAEFLGEWRPDAVAFQECGAYLASAIAQLSGWHHHEVRSLCFLSRYPLLDSAVMDRRALEQLNESNAGIGGSGDVERYVLRTPNGAVSMTNLHLETPRKGLENLLGGTFSSSKLQDNTELRAIEAELAKRWVAAGAGPAIVVGDFNTPVESRIFRKYWGDMTDAFSRAGFGLGMTRDNGWIRVRIDHVLTDRHWIADRIQLGSSMGSDHLPLIVDLTLLPRE